VVATALATAALTGLGYEGASNHLWPFIQSHTHNQAQGKTRHTTQENVPRRPSTASVRALHISSTPDIPVARPLRPKHAPHATKPYAVKTGSGPFAKHHGRHNAAAHHTPRKTNATSLAKPKKPKSLTVKPIKSRAGSHSEPKKPKSSKVKPIKITGGTQRIRQTHAPKHGHR
jgi:hypothetical protein